ncbi:hypothetical protein EZV62_001151 [Acer yangbiense]|uniref:Uncharacterized protein n=1 Tax=Acer yangbiense TaxID=1000413 RepID=A0A5C7IVM9_9ROSI|nr:hypothetical protein EZV62_001151 [Acer yangbiense]
MVNGQPTSIAICVYSKKELSADSSKGVGHLKAHANKCLAKHGGVESAQIQLMVNEKGIEKWKHYGLNEMFGREMQMNGKKYNMMTTNIAEAVNNYIKKARRLPITSATAMEFQRGAIIQKNTNLKSIEAVDIPSLPDLLLSESTSVWWRIGQSRWSLEDVRTKREENLS